MYFCDNVLKAIFPICALSRALKILKYLYSLDRISPKMEEEEKGCCNVDVAGSSPAVTG